jgi:hypothetical protein
MDNINVDLMILNNMKNAKKEIEVYTAMQIRNSASKHKRSDPVDIPTQSKKVDSKRVDYT